MKIKIDGILENGYLKDKYSKYASDSDKVEGVPYINFPFEVSEISKKYISFCFIDHDAYPVVNFSWIHWLVANYDYKRNGKVEENLALSGKEYDKGVNSYASPLANIKNEKIINNYGGPTPPDKDHDYTLYVYEHDNKLDLNDGYYYNEFLNEVEKQEVVKVKIKIKARK